MNTNFRYKILTSKSYIFSKVKDDFPDIDYKVDVTDGDIGQTIRIQVTLTAQYIGERHAMFGYDEYFVPYGQNITDLVPITVELTHLSFGRVAGHLHGRYNIVVEGLPTLHQLHSQAYL